MQKGNKKRQLRKPQRQPRPGSERKLVPQPVFDYPDKKASNKLKGKIALITGGDSGQRARRCALHRLGGAKVLIIDGHLRGAGDQRARCRLVVRRPRRTPGGSQRCRGRGHTPESHSAESTACASLSSALTPNCPDGLVVPASSARRTATSTRRRSSPSAPRPPSRPFCLRP